MVRLQQNYFSAGGFNLSTGVIHYVENYRRVIRQLPPFSGEGESHADKTEADNHVPRTNARNWIAGRCNIKNDYPDKADKKSSDHGWGKPPWAFCWSCEGTKDIFRDDLLILLAEF